MPTDDERSDKAWKLLLEARTVEPKPFFAQQVCRAATSQPRSLWERLFGGREPVLGFAALAATAAVVLIAVVGLSRLGTSGEPAIAGDPAPVMEIPAGLKEVPEVIALEEEIDNIGEFVELASVLNVNDLLDEEIDRLLF